MGQEISVIVNYVVEKLRGEGKDLGGENWMNYAVEKLREKERDLGVGNWMNFVVKSREKERDLGLGNWMNYVVKSKEWLVVLENFGTSSIGKVVDWLQVTLSIPTCLGSTKVHLLSILRPYVPWVSTIGAATLLLVILYNLSGGGGGGGGKAAVRMMKAPGRSYQIPRPGFEANPRLYFRGLRGKPV